MALSIDTEPRYQVFNANKNMSRIKQIKQDIGVYIEQRCGNKPGTTAFPVVINDAVLLTLIDKGIVTVDEISKAATEVFATK